MRRRVFPFGFSLALHAAVLGWVAAGPARETAEKLSLYDMAIRPYEKHLVWYTFRDKLPEVSPLERHGPSRPPRAEVKAPQVVTANPPGARRANQLVWLPAPRIQLREELRSPNLMALGAPAALPAPPARPRAFAPPVPAPVGPRPAPKLELPPDLQPRAQVSAPMVAAARLEPRAFRPPLAGQRAPAGAPEVELPPALQSRAQVNAPIAQAARPEPRAFRPGLPERRPAAGTPELTAPALHAANQNPKLALPIGSGAPARLEPRAFRPELENRRPAVSAPLVAEPPEIAAGVGGALAAGGVVPGTAPARPQPRAFNPGAIGGGAAGSPVPQLEAPQLAMGGAPGRLGLAVVGLHPAERLEAPPEGSREARFSAGPSPRANGGEGEPVESARIFVPGLMVRNGPPSSGPVLIPHLSPTSPENLRRIARAMPPAAASIPAPGSPAATRVTSAPDPMLEGRTVYTMAVQMPNITSYSGSWLIWFAERGEPPVARAGVAPPVPLHKVDPKYVASAMADRVEGKVRLGAVIRADGSVDSVVLLAHLDDRLDLTAQEALRKWQFEPARRNGKPVEVDAVVEIPFRLAPRVAR